MSDWCILRTSGRNTLPLAESLKRARFEVWTPATSKRLPRRRAERPAPLMPTYVFAKSGHLLDLLDLADAPASIHPSFSVFHYLDRIPLIADDELNALRQIEAKRARREKQGLKFFSSGDFVRINEGAFSGMSGIVKRSNGKFALVTFDRMEVSVATFLLHPGDARKAA